MKKNNLFTIQSVTVRESSEWNISIFLESVDGVSNLECQNGKDIENLPSPPLPWVLNPRSGTMVGTHMQLKFIYQWQNICGLESCFLGV